MCFAIFYNLLNVKIHTVFKDNFSEINHGLFETVWRGWMTVTSQAVSSPPVQCGKRTSAGRRSSPGRRNLPSLDGPIEAATAVLQRALQSKLYHDTGPQSSNTAPTISLCRFNGSYSTKNVVIIFFLNIILKPIEKSCVWTLIIIGTFSFNNKLNERMANLTIFSGWFSYAI